MNRYAIFHKPESNFAYAATKNTLTLILRVAADDKFDQVEILYNNKYDFTKKRYACKMRYVASDGIFGYYRADITLPDARFAYIFRITENGKIFYYSEEGLSEEYRFDVAYYTFFQFPFINTADVMQVVDWTKSAVFYQIFVERFARGDFEKDDKYINTPWDGKIDRYSFTGGDLDGITDKLSYLSGLGITALYLTPIFSSDSNHKYSIKNYVKVDPHFGNNEKLKRLLCAAHDKNIKIIIDTVFNHCDSDHEIFRDVEEKGRASKYYEWFIIDGDFPDRKRGNYACFADCKHMPKWNTNNPEVRRYLIDIALEYLSMGFDGLRLDVADEVSHEMWRQLRREVKEKFPEALIIGEIWHNNEHWLRGDQLDGVMNYKLQKILADYFGKVPVSAEDAANRMNGLLIANTGMANAMALNFLDNHDTPRFFRTAGGNTDKLLCALSAMVMFPGMPCVFYGTELPLDGAGDPDCRKTFDWSFKNQSETYRERFQAILGLKKQTALSGTDAEITAENGLLKITRKEDGESVAAYFNTSGKAKPVVIDGEILFALNCKDNRILNDGTLVVKNKNH
ncbi:MAG: glycoside hydrolase family 13 protein [Clostridia bacterium]|nr:glycoside hydrolase family 13 protein [Clostridia bacterium]